jgi:aspartate-semialdehyde dehydrogenase
VSGYNVAIVGATGAVGARMIKMVEQTSLPVNSVKLLASSRSAGKQLQFNGQALTVEETVPESFEGIDLALFSAGGSVSKKFAPEAVKRGAVVVDNTSAFRMDPKIPLVVPEVNPEALKLHHGIVANPNCSTIQMVVALEPVRKAFGLKRVIVSTYQAVGGAGNRALKELHDETEAYLKGEEMEAHILPVAGDKKHYPIAFNALPQIDVFEEDGYTHEEWKMIHETKKIMCGGDMDSKDIKVTATCVSDSGASESLRISFTLKLKILRQPSRAFKMLWQLHQAWSYKTTLITKFIRKRIMRKVLKTRSLVGFVLTKKRHKPSTCGTFPTTS